MKIILYDGPAHERLRPLTFGCPVGMLRLGVRPLHEKWSCIIGQPVDGFLPPVYLREMYPAPLEDAGDVLFIAADVVPHHALWQEIAQLRPHSRLVFDEATVAYRSDTPLDLEAVGQLPAVGSAAEVRRLLHPWDFFRLNGEAIAQDMALGDLPTTGDRPQARPDLHIRGQHPVVVHPRAHLESAVLNATDGPIFIGPDALIMEGSIIRGPFALCDEAVVKMGARIYGQTTIGPHCKVGGELNNVLMMAYSNKGHDGFLGNSVLGSWCNLGADTNNSNLKNNYGEVRMWSYPERATVETGLQFCGLIMGDHSKTGINTMLNTGTVLGMAVNAFGGGFPPRFMPSFSWGGPEGLEIHRLDEALKTAERMMRRRGLRLDPRQTSIFRHVFEIEQPTQVPG